MEPNDKELFEQAISNEPPAEVEVKPEVTQEANTEAGRARDEQGRFAAKEQQTEPVQTEPVAAAQAPAADKDAHVPSWRLREVNEAREAAERRATDAFNRLSEMEQQLAQLRQQNTPKAEPVDFFQDPNAAFKQNVAPLESQIQQLGAGLGLKVSRALAMVEHGKDAVAEMEKAIGEAMTARHPGIPQLRAQMQGSDDPVGLAMQWYQREKLLQETGGDLSAYKTRMFDEALKDPAFLAKALEAAKAQASGQAPGAKPNNLVQLPPSINRQTSAASPHEQAGDMSDASLYAAATR